MNKYAVLVGIIVGNFLSEYIKDVPDFLVATERSYFMVMAILGYIFLEYLDKKFKG